VTSEYLEFNQYYPEAYLGIWTFLKSISIWRVRLMPATKYSIKFHFIKNDNKDLVKKMLIHTLKVWVHELAMVVLMLEDLIKKWVVAFVCLIDKISDELSLTSANKGFRLKELKDKIAQDVYDRWDEFFEVLQIENNKSARDSQRAFKRVMINFDGSSKSHPTKKPRKEKFKA
jgi:hypothetical protein